MAPHILVLCSRNVCRSPLAARLLAHGVRGTASVDSAALEIAHGAPACEAASQRGAEMGAPTDTHRSTRVSTEAIGRADLVITMTVEQRGAVVRMDPSARSRTFTLRELGLLAGAPGVPGARRLPPPEDPAVSILFSSWVKGLDAARVRTPLPRAEEPQASFIGRLTGRRGRGTRPDPLDIPDGHADPRSGAHDATLQAVVESCVRLWAPLSVALGDPSPAH